MMFYNGFENFCWRFIGHGGMFFGGLLLLGLIVLLVVLLTNRNRGNGEHHQHSISSRDAEEALRILNDRYAKGEIGDDEYQHKKTELRKQ